MKKLRQEIKELYDNFAIGPSSDQPKLLLRPTGPQGDGRRHQAFHQFGRIQVLQAVWC